jgi:hypothetical protein
VVRGLSPAQGVPGEGQYSIDTDMLQLQVGGRREISFTGQITNEIQTSNNNKKTPGL